MTDLSPSVVLISPIAHCSRTFILPQDTLAVVAEEEGSGKDGETSGADGGVEFNGASSAVDGVKEASGTDEVGVKELSGADEVDGVKEVSGAL